MRVRSLGQEDPLEKEMATHSSILARRIPWTEEPGGHRVRHNLETEQQQELLYNIVLVSAVQQHEPVTCIHKSSPS